MSCGYCVYKAHVEHIQQTSNYKSLIQAYIMIFHVIKNTFALQPLQCKFTYQCNPGMSYTNGDVIYIRGSFRGVSGVSRNPLHLKIP